MRSRMIGFAFCLVLLWGGFREAAIGQSRGSLPPNSSLSSWNARDETTVGGVIREVVGKNTAGAPAGLNFVMTGSQHALTVNAGRGLDPQFRDMLRAGASIRVTGVVRSFAGQDYLLARELIVGGQTIQVRDANGFPVHALANGGTRQRHVESDLNGGAR